MWWIPKGFCILESKSLKVSCNVLGLEEFLTLGCVDPLSPKYRLSSIICDVASFRLFKPVRSEPLHDNNRKFLHIPFANKGIDAINIKSPGSWGSLQVVKIRLYKCDEFQEVSVY
jgi:hypothetical protein